MGSMALKIPITLPPVAPHQVTWKRAPPSQPSNSLLIIIQHLLSFLGWHCAQCLTHSPLPSHFIDGLTEDGCPTM